MAAPDPDSAGAQPLPESPLPPCRYPTNCVRESRAFPADADRLFEAAERAVREAAGLTTGRVQDVRPDPMARRFDARFSVLGFVDDFAVAVEPHAGGAALHVRSASRTGRGDLGVNRRRVRAFLQAVEKDLES